MLNTYQLDSVTIPLYLGTNDAVADADRTSYSPTTLIGYNNAYPDMCLKMGLAKAWQAITLSATKTYTLSGLTYKLAKILCVAQYQDGSSSANYGEAKRYNYYNPDNITLIVPDADASSTVYIYYQYIPALLVLPTPTSQTGATSPSLLPDQYLIALSYAAIAELFGSLQHDPARAMYWLDKYNAVVKSALSPTEYAVENTTGW